MKKQIIDKSTYEEYKTKINVGKEKIKNIVSVVACILVISAFIIGIVVINVLGTSGGFASLGIAALITLIVYAILYGCWITKYQNAVDEYEEAQEQEKRCIEETLRKQQETNAQNLMGRLDDIKKTIIVETHTGKDNDNTMTRGVVGALLFGATGAIVGTATAQEKTYTTFLIIYNDDSRTTQTVENGTTLYNHYIKYLEV